MPQQQVAAVGIADGFELGAIDPVDGVVQAAGLQFHHRYTAW